jgi:hypothetical protein
MTTLSVAAIPAVLFVMGVRDWRAYGLVFIWSPVIAAWHTANLSVLLVLGIALVWRHRDRSLAAGMLAALVISLKPYVWPIGIWLLATRRYKAAVAAAITGLALNAAAWGIVGFGEIGRWIHLNSVFIDREYREGYGVLAGAAHLGVGRSAAVAAETALAAVLVVACVVLGRHGREQAALTIAVGAMLIGSPVVWSHYFVLVLVPLSLAHPRLSKAWLLPLLLWVCPAHGMPTWQALVAWLVVGGGLIALLRRPAVGTATECISGPSVSVPATVGMPR